MLEISSPSQALSMDELFLETAPPLDPAWLAYAEEQQLDQPQAKVDPLIRQPIYAKECRKLTAKMTAPGARDHHLVQDMSIQDFTVPSSRDKHPIPIRVYESSSVKHAADGPIRFILYIHGGGLFVGEADSEELSCLRIAKQGGLGLVRVFSVGYRLMPTYPATMCLADCLDAFDHVSRTAEGSSSKTSIFLVGSSSGGELAALVSQAVSPGLCSGIVLRGPVTVDANSGAPGAKEYIPEDFRERHHSATHPSFHNALGRGLSHEIPRDGLAFMPLDVRLEELRTRRLPRTWIQVCTNDFLYSDGVCYAALLTDAGVDVKVDVVRGWPHTFWLKAPHLPAALEAERAMLRGLAWVVTGEEHA